MKDVTTVPMHQRAKLIQAIEKLWPGSGAHTKRNHDTSRDEVAVGEHVSPAIQREIRLYVSGWETGSALVSGIFSTDKRERARKAQTELENLFSSSGGGRS